MQLQLKYMKLYKKMLIDNIKIIYDLLIQYTWVDTC